MKAVDLNPSDEWINMANGWCSATSDHEEHFERDLLSGLVGQKDVET